MFLKLSINSEKTYFIDKAGNAQVEKKWNLHNPASVAINITDLYLYTTETWRSITNIEAHDNSGILPRPTCKSIGVEHTIIVKPRIDSLVPDQKYTIIINYKMSEIVSRLGEIWLFSEYFTWSGKKKGRGALADPRSDVKIKFLLPKLTKWYEIWKTVFSESKPLAKEMNVSEREYCKELEWNESFSSKGDAIFLHLIYGVKKRERLLNVITAVTTAVLVKSIDYLFKILSG